MISLFIFVGNLNWEMLKLFILKTMWNLKKNENSGFIFCLLPQFSQNKNANEMSSRFMDVSPCDFRPGHVYTHTHIVILCLRGKRDFPTRFVWVERTSTIPRVLSHIERYGCVRYICFGICKQVNNDEIIENKIHFSRWDQCTYLQKLWNVATFEVFLFSFFEQFTTKNTIDVSFHLK